MAQKARWFAEMGVDNMFRSPGVREFFLDIATSPDPRITHVSRLEVGAATVATNFGLRVRRLLLPRAGELRPRLARWRASARAPRICTI